MIITLNDIEVPMGHRLVNYKGRCAHPHGHNYLISVEIEGVPNSLGLVMDYSDLKYKVMTVLDQFDHSFILYDSDPLVQTMTGYRLILLNCNPSAENIASCLFNQFQDHQLQVRKVIVRETLKTSAIATAVDRGIRMKVDIP